MDCNQHFVTCNIIYRYKSVHKIYKIMQNQPIIDQSYILKERDKKHRQIMNAIYTFKRTPDQLKMLDKIKQSTQMEIDLRYKNCTHNHTYKFPYFENSFDQDSEQQQQSQRRVVLYDLNAQTQVVKKSMSTKVLSLDATRRVKSLQKQHVEDEDQIINKIKRRNIRIGAKSPELFDYIGRKNSMIDRRTRNRSVLRLPELKKIPSGKTVPKNDLQEVVGKKIHTQSSSPDGKRLAKYLKVVSQNSKQQIRQRPKKFFLKQI